VCLTSVSPPLVSVSVTHPLLLRPPLMTMVLLDDPPPLLTMLVVKELLTLLVTLLVSGQRAYTELAQPVHTVGQRSHWFLRQYSPEAHSPCVRHSMHFSGH